MKANILVVDDEESIRFTFHRFLAAEGHNVITAESYSEALSKMDAMEFELILADIILGDGCGINILQELKQRIVKTRVIIMTAYPAAEIAQNSLYPYAIDYLIKPLRQQELLFSINKALQQMKHGKDRAQALSGRYSPFPGKAHKP